MARQTTIPGNNEKKNKKLIKLVDILVGYRKEFAGVSAKMNDAHKVTMEYMAAEKIEEYEDNDRGIRVYIQEPSGKRKIIIEKMEDENPNA